MRVLCINCGSSTLKIDIRDIAEGSAQSRVGWGEIDRIGSETELTFATAGRTFERRLSVADHRGALDEALAVMDETGLLRSMDAIGHRVVHGGVRLKEPVLIDDAVTEAIDAVSELAPLHNQPALQAIEAARMRFAGTVPMVATFDTAFYAGLPDVAGLYAIPRELSEKHSIRRYGFHGLAHRYMVQRFRQLRPDVEAPRLITLQLGNGCSATASRDGMPLDTSMGFTPLEGLIMGTRAGDLDPSLPLFLAEKERLPLREVESLLNRRSGLLGLSTTSSDVRDLLQAAADGDRMAEFAIDAFCYRIRKYIGAYMAVLGGADAIIFGGGIGERSAEIRERICGGLEWTGLRIDAGANAATSGDRLISPDGGSIEAWVVEVDEADVIAQDVAAFIGAVTGRS